jgi:hypothetical protein
MVTVEYLRELMAEAKIRQIVREEIEQHEMDRVSHPVDQKIYQVDYVLNDGTSVHRMLSVIEMVRLIKKLDRDFNSLRTLYRRIKEAVNETSQGT